MLSAALPWHHGEKSGTLLYPAAGFDWKLPLVLTRLCRRSSTLPGFELAIYVDYSTRLTGQLAAANSAGDCMYWGPDVVVNNIREVIPPAGMVWNLRSSGRHDPEGGSGTGDYWYFLELHLPRFTLPILYVPADAVAFVREVMTPLNLRPTYVATVTDGCRQGGNWCCLSRKESPFYQALLNKDLLPDYWLADHGDLDFPVLAKAKTGVYGRGESKLMAIH